MQGDTIKMKPVNGGYNIEAQIIKPEEYQEEILEIDHTANVKLKVIIFIDKAKQEFRSLKFIKCKKTKNQWQETATTGKRLVIKK